MVCSRHLGHMSKMATTPLYVMIETLQKTYFSEPGDRFRRNLVCTVSAITDLDYFANMHKYDILAG